MILKTVLTAAAAVLLVGGAASAEGRFGAPVPPAGLPGVFGNAAGAPVVLAQADTSTGALQEEIRRLNGRVEELNFQILQMQEQLRKMQEDNEFRFQELEGGSGSGKKTEAAPAAQEMRQAQANPASASRSAPPARPGDPVSDVIASADPSIVPPADVPGGGELQPKTMGTITFDQDGNVVGGNVGDQIVIDADPNGTVQQPGADNTVVAALPKTDDPETLYRDSYQYILSGQYATAEAGFSDHINRFPNDARAADANFWLGESQLGQRKYREAAETFLAASKAYPKSKKAPDMMLKLGVSLVGLDQRRIACATFAEIGKRYPDASKTMRQRVQQEQAAASC